MALVPPAAARVSPTTVTTTLTPRGRSRLNPLQLPLEPSGATGANVADAEILRRVLASWPFRRSVSRRRGGGVLAQVDSNGAGARKPEPARASQSRQELQGRAARTGRQTRAAETAEQLACTSPGRFPITLLFSPPPWFWSCVCVR